MNRDELIARIGEAYETYRRLPDPDRKYRVAQMASWPQHVRDAVEAYGYGTVAVRLASPTPAEIDRAEELLGWMGDFLKLHPVGAKLLWLSYGRGLKMPQCVELLRREGVRIKRAHAFVKRQVALDVLLSGVSKTVQNSLKKAS